MSSDSSIRPRRAVPFQALGRLAVGLAAAVLLSACTANPQQAPAAEPSQPTPVGTSAPSSGAPSSGAPAPALTARTLAARLPTPLSRLVALSLGGRVVIVGGLDARQATTARTEIFDPTSGGVRAASTLPVAVHDAGGGVVSGRALVVGGGAASSTDAVQRVQADGTASLVGHLPQPRSDDSVAVDGPTAYVVGGYDGTHELPGVLATTDGVRFHQVGRLGMTVRYGAAYAAPGAVWVFGGEHHGVPTPDIQRVDTTTGASSVRARFPHPLAHAAVAVLGDQVLVIGGTDGHTPQNTIYAFDPTTSAVRVVGSLPESVSDMATAVVGDTAFVIGGQALTAEQTVAPTAAVVALTMRTVAPGATAQGAGSQPFDGQLLIADRGNNRLLLVDPRGRIDWQFPTAHTPSPSPAQGPSPAPGFYFPDDAFFIDHGTAIISNQEGSDTIVKIAYPGGRSLWSYGHPGTPGAGPGYLHEPDDAFQLKDGRVVVADANNCRVLIISSHGRQVGQIGTTGRCVHEPPHALGYPNGDTPLRDGGLLISEVTGSWISEYRLTGTLVWSVHLPLTYPSDPQQIGPDRYLVADYAKPGGIVEFDRAGHILWQYRVPGGHGMLDHPSLAEMLPTGLICVNDDYRHRVVLIDPHSNRIVWQYGVDDLAGTAPGLLNTPDGLDLLRPDGTTPTHPWTG